MGILGRSNARNLVGPCRNQRHVLDVTAVSSSTDEETEVRDDKYYAEGVNCDVVPGFRLQLLLTVRDVEKR